MSPEQIGVILAAAAARDARTIGTADVLAWHEDIGDLDFADSLAAVSRHYRATTDRLMPAHVRRIVGEVDRERRRADREASAAKAIEPPRPANRERVRAILADLAERYGPGRPEKLYRPGHPRYRGANPAPATLNRQETTP